MRVKVEELGTCRYGDLVGLMRDEEHDTVGVVVKLDGCGMMLKSFHPSKVSVVESTPAGGNPTNTGRR